MKKALIMLLIISFCPIFTTGCEKTNMLAPSKKAEKEAEINQEQNSNAPDARGGVIYLGKEYDNSSFGPGRVKFVFE